MQHVKGPSSFDEGGQRFLYLRTQNLCSLPTMQHVKGPKILDRCTKLFISVGKSSFLPARIDATQKISVILQLKWPVLSFFERVISIVCFH